MICFPSIFSGMRKVGLNMSFVGRTLGHYTPLCHTPAPLSFIFSSIIIGSSSSGSVSVFLFQFSDTRVCEQGAEGQKLQTVLKP